LDQEKNEPLYAYAQFLGESTEYELNELLANDKDSVWWRADHPRSCIPRIVVRRSSDALSP
jgi:hypothetical protein